MAKTREVRTREVTEYVYYTIGIEVIEHLSQDANLHILYPQTYFLTEKEARVRQVLKLELHKQLEIEDHARSIHEYNEKLIKEKLLLEKLKERT